MMQLLCFAMFACAFNLLLGYSGMLSFGHAAFFGAAAYATSWLVTAHGWGSLEAVVAGIAVSTLLGLVIGALAICRHGIYFAMITLALSQLVYFVCLEAPFTGGENGIQGVPRGTVLGILSLAQRCRDVLCRAGGLRRGVPVHPPHRAFPFGQVLKAIRENEPRAVSLGYRINRYKLLAFVLSAALVRPGRIAQGPGARLRHALRRAAIDLGTVVLMALLGGTGTFFGPVIGAAVIVTLQEYLSDRVGGWVTVIIGAIFVACVMPFRRGVVGELSAWLRRKPV